jgi:hypothetical protein
MIANNFLEIYTLMFGWNLYSAIWDVLVGSGLALIPFLAAIITSFTENYENSDAQTTLKEIEIKVVCMVLVLMLCVIPYRGFEVDLATVKYNLEVPDCNPPDNTSGEGDNTDTAFDGAFGDEMGGLTIYKPVAWSFVEFLSSAITHSTIRSMSCTNNYEFMLMRVGQVTVQKPELRARVKDFYQVCYKKALERFNANPTALPGNVAADQDINWMGSRVLLETPGEYYQHPSAYMTNMERYGFTRDEVNRPSDAAHASGANPTCKEVWLGEEQGGVVDEDLGLRKQLLEDIPEDEVGDVLEDWMDWGSNVMTEGAVDDDVKEDLMLKMVIQADAANLKSKTNVDLSNDFDTKDDTVSELVNGALSLTGLYASLEGWLQANTMKQMLKTAGPMILALIQMIIIMASPFVLLLGHYQVSGFISVALAYFSFEFINAIWAAGFWFDNRVLDMYTSQAGTFDVITNTIMVSMVSAGATIILPSVWLAIMATAGATMVRGMGVAGVGGGAAAGAGAMSGAAGKVGSAAYNKVSNRGAQRGGQP